MTKKIKKKSDIKRYKVLAKLIKKIRKLHKSTRRRSLAFDWTVLVALDGL